MGDGPAECERCGLVSPAGTTRCECGHDFSTAGRRLSFHGAGSALFGIGVVNVLLVLLTLGIFVPWARVRVRRYLLGQTEIEGDRLTYHGTGGELFVGYLKAFVLFGLPFNALLVGPAMLGASRPVRLVTELMAYGVVAVLIPVAVVGARRYRLSRTAWRGVRFSFRGGMRAFVRLFLGGGALTLLTLGLYYPFWLVRRQGFLISGSWFGSEPFRFDGHGRDLWRPYLIALVLALPTLGLSWAWFTAAQQRYVWERTSFATARFHYAVTGGALLLLWLGNVVLALLSLGLAHPWIVVRNARFVTERLRVTGPLDLQGIVQQSQPASATGEGLAGFFDSGLDLG